MMPFPTSGNSLECIVVLKFSIITHPRGSSYVYPVVSMDPPCAISHKSMCPSMHLLNSSMHPYVPLRAPLCTPLQSHIDPFMRPLANALHHQVFDIQ